jgi:hypothetical protein
MQNKAYTTVILSYRYSIVSWRPAPVIFKWFLKLFQKLTTNNSIKNDKSWTNFNLNSRKKQFLLFFALPIPKRTSCFWCHYWFISVNYILQLHIKPPLNFAQNMCGWHFYTSGNIVLRHCYITPRSLSSHLPSHFLRSCACALWKIQTYLQIHCTRIYLRNKSESLILITVNETTANYWATDLLCTSNYI